MMHATGHLSLVPPQVQGESSRGDESENEANEPWQTGPYSKQGSSQRWARPHPLDH
jgi:hypothetical protein